MKIHLFRNQSSHRTGVLSVVDRMITIDIMKTLGTVLSILVLIIVTRRFLRVLSKAIEGEISGGTIFTILGLKIIATVSILLPPAIFLSVLMVLGRMYRDNEMTILAASGVGLSRTFRSIIILAVPLSLVTAIFSMKVLPWSNLKTQEIMAFEERSADIRGISAGRFNEYSRGDLVFYVEEIKADKTMHNIFVQNRQHGKLGIITSESGYVKEDSSGARYIVLQDGYRYQGRPGTTDYSVTKFGEYAVRVDENTSQVTADRDATDSLSLWYSPLPRDQAELQKRISIPLGTLILSLLAIPLAKITPSGGIYGNFLTAFLIYITYENLLRVSQTWITTALVPPWIGIWWVYLLMLMVILLLIVRDVGTEWIVHVVIKRGIH